MQRNKGNTEGMTRSWQCTQNLSLRLCPCPCPCLCQTNLHMRVAQQTPPNRQKLQSQASDHRKQNACFSGVHSEVGWGQQLHARASLRSLHRPPCSGLSAGNQHTGEVGRRRQSVMLHRISVATHLAASRDKHVDLPAFDFAPGSLHGSICTFGLPLAIGCIHCQRTPPHQQCAEPDSPCQIVGPVWTFRRRTAWLTSDMPADAQMRRCSWTADQSHSQCPRRTKLRPRSQ